MTRQQGNNTKIVQKLYEIRSELVRTRIEVELSYL